MNWAEFLVSHAGQLVLLAVLLACSALFSGSETALFSLTRGQLHRFRGSPNRLRRAAAALMVRPRAVLNTVLLGNMLVNTAYSVICALIVLDLGRRGAAAWILAAASLGPLIVLILVGEVSPKMTSYGVAPRWAELAAVPLTLLGRAFAPVLWLVDVVAVSPLTRLLAPRARARSAITAEELAAVMDLSARRGVISHDVNQLIQEIMELTALRAADIMVPRVDMVSYSVEDPPEGLATLFRRTHLRRIPVYEGDVDHVIGVVQAKRLLLSPAAPVRQLVVKVPFVPEAASLERVLLQFRVTRSQVAVVVDEYGGTAGLVTLKDLLEEIVGDFPETPEQGAAPAVERISDREYLVLGNLACHEWADAFQMDLASRRISTIGGFVTSLLGRIPQAGDTATHGNVRFTVKSMRRWRVEKVRVELLEDRS